MFGDLRKYITLFFEFQQIEGPLTEPEGLNNFLQWALKAGAVLGLPEEVMAKAKLAVDNPEAFNLLLAAVRFTFSMFPDTFSGNDAETSDQICLAMPGDELTTISRDQLNEWLPFAAQLVTFNGELRGSIS